MKKMLLIITLGMLLVGACNYSTEKVIEPTEQIQPTPTATPIPEPTATVEFCNEEIAKRFMGSASYLGDKLTEILEDIREDFDLALEAGPLISALQAKNESIEKTPCVEDMADLQTQLLQEFSNQIDRYVSGQPWDFALLITISERILDEIEIINIWLER